MKDMKTDRRMASHTLHAALHVAGLLPTLDAARIAG